MPMVSRFGLKDTGRRLHVFVCLYFVLFLSRFTELGVFSITIDGYRGFVSYPFV